MTVVEPLLICLIKRLLTALTNTMGATEINSTMHSTDEWFELYLTPIICQ